MPQTQIQMQGSMSKKDADLLVRWLTHQLEEFIALGLALTHERVRGTTTLTLIAPLAQTLKEAEESIRQLAFLSSSHT